MEVGGIEYEIRSDFRAILDICSAIEDAELDMRDKAIVALDIFYTDIEDIPRQHHKEALRKCFWFINGGTEDVEKKGPQLMSWEQDVQYIIAPINRVVGGEVRALEYLHWWTFLAAYMEIGDCTFAQIVRIRNLRATGKPMTKEDREWYTKHHYLVDIKTTYTQAEHDVLDLWTNTGR
jgi:hypothetical protein